MSNETLPDWFHGYAAQYFDAYLGHYAGRPNLHFLQIGAYTGDATIWLMEHVLTDQSSRLDDVDMWGGSTEPGDRGLDFADVEKEYDRRTAQYRESGRIHKYKGTSTEWFSSRTRKPEYDFIYVDGDHSAFGVLNDAVDAYHFLKPHGILAFDDYLWISGEGYLRDPAQAIDSFLYIYADRFAVLIKSIQVWLQRIK